MIVAEYELLKNGVTLREKVVLTDTYGESFHWVDGQYQPNSPSEDKFNELLQIDDMYWIEIEGQLLEYLGTGKYNKNVLKEKGVLLKILGVNEKVE